jgi:hypothetical protein
VKKVVGIFDDHVCYRWRDEGRSEVQPDSLSVCGKLPVSFSSCSGIGAGSRMDESEDTSSLVFVGVALVFFLVFIATASGYVFVSARRLMNSAEMKSRKVDLQTKRDTVKALQTYLMDDEAKFQDRFDIATKRGIFDEDNEFGKILQGNHERLKNRRFTAFKSYSDSVNVKK